MKLENKKIGFAVTGSCCNFKEVKDVIELLKKEGVGHILPIVSDATKNMNTRFYRGKDFVDMLEEVTKNKVIDTIPKAEPIGPKNLVDIIVVCPCTRKYFSKTCKWNNRYSCINVN